MTRRQDRSLENYLKRILRTLATLSAGTELAKKNSCSPSAISSGVCISQRAQNCGLSRNRCRKFRSGTLVTRVVKLLTTPEHRKRATP